MPDPRLVELLSPELARTLGAAKSVGAVEAQPTGIDALDEQLRGGFPKGALTEIFAAPGHGGAWLATRTLALAIRAAIEPMSSSSTQSDPLPPHSRKRAKTKSPRSKPAPTTPTTTPGHVTRLAAIIDPTARLHPPTLAAHGIDLARVLWLRVSERKQVLWALERIAREPAVAITIARVERLNDAELRRIQLAAEASGQVVTLLRPPSELTRASWGAVRLAVYAEPSSMGVSPMPPPQIPDLPWGRGRLARASSTDEPSIETSSTGVAPIPPPQARDLFSATWGRGRLARTSATEQRSIESNNAPTLSENGDTDETSVLHATPTPRRLRVEVVRMRGGGMPSPVVIEVDDAGAVRTAAAAANRTTHVRHA